MPTGYTAGVEDGTITDFRTYALRCARAFGATIMQRENPMDEAPQHRKVEDYYRTSVERAEAELARLNTMTFGEAEAAWEAEYQKNLAYHAERITQDTTERNRYNAMLAEVTAWNPPTPDHVQLKEFMAEQIRISRSDYETPSPRRVDTAKWLADRREHAVESLARSRQNLFEEEERCRKSNAWIDALYKSLEPSASASRVGVSP